MKPWRTHAPPGTRRGEADAADPGFQAADALVAVAVFALGVADVYGRLSSSGLVERPADGFALVLIAVPSLALPFRRTAPVPAGLVAVGCGVVYYGAGYPGVIAAAPTLVMIYTAAALRRAGEERLWIAQELHDSLTHAISVVNVQVAVALQALDHRPELAREALMAIKESGHEAIGELRATLGVLRQADPDGPEAGLARLPRLAARAEAAGLPVRTAVLGERRELPAEVDRAAYRIVQEALTNVLRHAGAATVTVTTEYRPDMIVLSVEDDGESGTGTGGMGLIGMRERAVAVGGTLTAGPRPQGGFAVRAELPAAGRRTERTEPTATGRRAEPTAAGRRVPRAEPPAAGRL
ncbi:sensor histidine kinase [Planomonospora corallina]|uniref:histidine kinase n=1 Tax=Planomonospora corallina TaxID=1806052 RepID=A0ABV8I672_9ACTN